MPPLWRLEKLGATSSVKKTKNFTTSPTIVVEHCLGELQQRELAALIVPRVATLATLRVVAPWACNVVMLQVVTLVTPRCRRLSPRSSQAFYNDASYSAALSLAIATKFMNVLQRCDLRHHVTDFHPSMDFCPFTNFFLNLNFIYIFLNNNIIIN